MHKRFLVKYEVNFALPKDDLLSTLIGGVNLRMARIIITILIY